MDVTPACGDDHACRACSAHPDCESHACLPTGACGTDTNVAYVDPTGSDNATCTKAMPCTKLSKALATTRPYVKFQGTTDEAVSINNQNVTLLADTGAKLTSTKNGLLLEVKGTSRVTIYDLEITGASGPGSFGISLPAGNTATLELHGAKITNNVGGGISASGGTLTVSQSTLSGNVGGGISMMNGTFAIVGNVFFNNGDVGASVGGIAITTTANAANRLEFNSFNQNRAQGGVGQAVSCVAGAFTARNNIMSDNGTIAQMEQLSGACNHSYSIVRPGALPVGTGNSASDPMFHDASKGDLHIPSGSPAQHAADPATDLTGIASRDIDGDLRVSPADIGADQIK